MGWDSSARRRPPPNSVLASRAVLLAASGKQPGADAGVPIRIGATRQRRRVRRRGRAARARCLRFLAAQTAVGAIAMMAFLSRAKTLSQVIYALGWFNGIQAVRRCITTRVCRSRVLCRRRYPSVRSSQSTAGGRTCVVDDAEEAPSPGRRGGKLEGGGPRREQPAGQPHCATGPPPPSGDAAAPASYVRGDGTAVARGRRRQGRRAGGAGHVLHLPEWQGPSTRSLELRLPSDAACAFQ